VFLFILITLKVFSANFGLVNERPVVIKDQVHSKLKMADVPGMDTQVVYLNQGIIPKHAKGVVLFWPGVGALQTSEYGFANSVSALVNAISKHGLVPIGFLPPMYQQLKKYSTLESNMEWFLSCLEFVKHHVAKAGLEKMPPIDLIGRSWGSGMVAEFSHRALLGKKGYEDFFNIRNILMLAVDGQAEEDIQIWHHAEETLLKGNIGDMDTIAITPDIYRAMKWQVGEVSTAEATKTPAMTWVIGLNDQFYKPEEKERLFTPLVSFAKNHPQIPLQVVIHSENHTMSSDLRNQVIQEFQTPLMTTKSRIQHVYLPSSSKVELKVGATASKICANVLTGMVSIAKPPVWKR
jgi:hypothetical protein